MKLEEEEKKKKGKKKKKQKTKKKERGRGTHSGPKSPPTLTNNPLTNSESKQLVKIGKSTVRKLLF
jgi:hypothetical protein